MVFGKMPMNRRTFTVAALATIASPALTQSKKRCWQRLTVSDINVKPAGSAARPGSPLEKTFERDLVTYTAVSKTTAFVFTVLQYRNSKAPVLKVGGNMRFAVEEDGVFLLDERANEFDVYILTVQSR